MDGAACLAFALALFLIAAWGGRAQCPTEIEVLQPISCSGADDGVITVSVPDGVDPADVFWLFETDTLFGAVQSGLGPGSYVAFVPGCSAALGINVNEPFPSSSPPRSISCRPATIRVRGVVTGHPQFRTGAHRLFSWSHDAVDRGPVGRASASRSWW